MASRVRLCIAVLLDFCRSSNALCRSNYVHRLATQVFRDSKQQATVWHFARKAIQPRSAYAAMITMFDDLPDKPRWSDT